MAYVAVFECTCTRQSHFEALQAASMQGTQLPAELLAQITQHTQQQASNRGGNGEQWAIMQSSSLLSDKRCDKFSLASLSTPFAQKPHICGVVLLLHLCFLIPYIPG